MFLVVIGAAFLMGVFIYIILAYNSLVRLRNYIDKSWSNIDVLLKQRNDELPNLVETVRGYMKHEKKLLLGITRARTALIKAETLDEKASADEAISTGIKNLFAVVEGYPELKANENFLKLQKRITGLENEIADRREFYNESVTNYNIKTDTLPTAVIARIFRFEKRGWFKASEEEKQNVKLDLDVE